MLGPESMKKNHDFQTHFIMQQQKPPNQIHLQGFGRSAFIGLAICCWKEGLLPVPGPGTSAELAIIIHFRI